MIKLTVGEMGRGIGAAIIMVGLFVAIWTVAEIDHVTTTVRIRFVLQQMINWVAYGSLVYLGAEILDQLVLRNQDATYVEDNGVALDGD